MVSISLKATCVGIAFLVMMSSAGAADKPVSYRLASRNGRVVIEASTGEIIPWACYSLPVPASLDNWAAMQHGFIKAGVHLFQISMWPTPQCYWANQFFSLDGKPLKEPRGKPMYEEQVAWLLEHDPQARFIVRFGIHPPPEWRKEHLDQYQTLPEGKKSFGSNDNRSMMPSLASELWLEGVDRLVRDLVGWCERQPWRDRVVGYTLFPHGEGATELAIAGDPFDTSPPMQKAFREFLHRKYSTDEALQQAWGDKDVRIDTATVPTKQEWLEKRKRLNLLHWPDPQKVQRERDYFLLQKQLFHRFWKRVFTAMQEATAERPVLKGYDILKQHMQGWMHNAWHPGALDEYGSILLASGSIGIGPLLDHQGIDMLQTPGMYYNRAMGYAWEAEGLSDSLALRCPARQAQLHGSRHAHLGQPGLARRTQTPRRPHQRRRRLHDASGDASRIRPHPRLGTVPQPDVLLQLRLRRKLVVPQPRHLQKDRATDQNHQKVP